MCKLYDTARLYSALTVPEDARRSAAAPQRTRPVQVPPPFMTKRLDVALIWTTGGFIGVFICTLISNSQQHWITDYTPLKTADSRGPAHDCRVTLDNTVSCWTQVFFIIYTQLTARIRFSWLWVLITCWLNYNSISISLIETSSFFYFHNASKTRMHFFPPKNPRTVFIFWSHSSQERFVSILCVTEVDKQSRYAFNFWN